ncbi:MAG: hypothetical protein HYW63_00275 [Candidatus Levybacteria bacterium]|nr:hypothetical protein [Candidatus Levybacteria bacterium]
MKNSKIDKDRIKQIYSRIVGIESYLQKEHPHNVRREIADNYSKLVNKLEELTNDNLEDFKIPPNAFYVDTNDYCYMDLFLPRLTEFRHFLEASFSFVKQSDLPGEVRIYLSIRQGIMNFIKKQVEKRL